MTESIQKIHELQERLSQLRPLNRGELKRLREEFAVNNTFHSNAIEGSTLTLRETALILQEGVTIAEKPIKEHLEAIGHRDAFAYITELTDTQTELSEKVIKEVHSLVLMADRENRGIYRRVPVYIMGSEHTPPQPYLVPKRMEELIEMYHKKTQSLDKVEAAAWLHLEFESIHPFIDGNGRTGRLLLNFELMKAGLLPVNIKYTDRIKYYDCFAAYHSEGHTAALTELIVDYEVQELERYIQMVQAVSES